MPNSPQPFIFNGRGDAAPKRPILEPKSRKSVGGQSSASERNATLKKTQKGVVLVDGMVSMAKTPEHLVDTYDRR